MFKERYQQMNEHLHPSEGLIQETLSAARPRKRTTCLPKRWTIAICCFALLLTTGTAIAGTFDLLPILERLFPDTAKDFCRQSQRHGAGHHHDCHAGQSDG